MHKRKNSSRNAFQATAMILLISIMTLMIACTQREEYQGTYERKGDNSEATITISRVDDTNLHITGIALWGLNNKYGPNIGEIDFKGPCKDGMIRHAVDSMGDNPYTIQLKFSGNELKVSEKNHMGYHGMNVTFEGNYSKLPEKDGS